MRSVRGIKEKTHTDWKTDLNKRKIREGREIVSGSDGEIYIYEYSIWLNLHYKKRVCTDWTNVTCQGIVIVGFVIFFTFLATSTSALP